MSDGYFGPESMAVRATRQRAVGLTWGQRALTIGAQHPRLYIGTAQHTEHRSTPYARLALTARLMETVFLGSKAEADRALAYTAKRHDTVRGTMSVDGGSRHPAGAPYSAYEPSLMWWTAAFALDSVEFMYDALVARLTPAQRQHLFEDYVRWAELFGMPRDAAPRSYEQFRTDFDAWLYSDEPQPVGDAYLVGRHLAGASGYNLPLRRISSPTLATIIQGSLPQVVRSRFDLSWSRTQESRWRLSCAASRLAHEPIFPGAHTPIMRGKSADFYRVVARREKALVASGGVSMPGVSDVPSPYRSAVS